MIISSDFRRYWGLSIRLTPWLYGIKVLNLKLFGAPLSIGK